MNSIGQLVNHLLPIIPSVTTIHFLFLVSCSLFLFLRSYFLWLSSGNVIAHLRAQNRQRTLFLFQPESYYHSKYFRFHISTLKFISDNDSMTKYIYTRRNYWLTVLRIISNYYWSIDEPLCYFFKLWVISIQIINQSFKNSTALLINNY